MHSVWQHDFWASTAVVCPHKLGPTLARLIRLLSGVAVECRPLFRLVFNLGVRIDYEGVLISGCSSNGENAKGGGAAPSSLGR